jgi:putative PIN family toxin of toxin-antitoxin system
MNIVVDTNVIVSALVFGGVPRRMFELIEAGHCHFFYSAEIESETRRVLRDKFGWDKDRLDRYLPALWNLGEQVTPQRRVRAVRDDPDDNRIIECALAAAADAIISGDRHLLRLGSFEEIRILSPRELLEAFS